MIGAVGVGNVLSSCTADKPKTPSLIFYDVAPMGRCSGPGWSGAEAWVTEGLDWKKFLNK